jgi:hypothetical protein
MFDAMANGATAILYIKVKPGIASLSVDVKIAVDQL